MIYQIITHTPVWVWGLLAALLVLGYVQTKPRTISLARSAILPIVMTALSILGTVTTFALQPSIAAAWLISAIVGVVLLLKVFSQSADQFDAAHQVFHVAGSWVPMVLIMGIFLTKYGVGVAIGMHPELAQNSTFAIQISALYGLFSGVFIGRALRLRRLQTSN